MTRVEDRLGPPNFLLDFMSQTQAIGMMRFA